MTASDNEADRAMDSTQLQALQQLRQAVPVGVRHARTLLQHCAGDVALAAERFRAETVQHLVAQSGLPAAQAEAYLRAAGYELPRALVALEEARFSLTQRMLRTHHRDPDRALGLIAGAVETVHGLKREYWLCLDQLQALPVPLCSFMTLHEWLSYEEWEGFDCALYFHLPLVLAELRRLQLDELATALEQADLRQRQLREQQPDPLLSISQDSLFAACEQTYQRLRPSLDAALLALVEGHIELFPQ